MERSVEKAAFGFFGAKQDFSGQELTEATDVDFVRTVALVTCRQGGEGEKIIGAGPIWHLEMPSNLTVRRWSLRSRRITMVWAGRSFRFVRPVPSATENLFS